MSGNLVCDLLERDDLEAQARERALQLLDTKLISELKSGAKTQTISSASEDGLDNYLEKVASKLSSWLLPAENEAEKVSLMSQNVRAVEKNVCCFFSDSTMPTCRVYAQIAIEVDSSDRVSECFR